DNLAPGHVAKAERVDLTAGQEIEIDAAFDLRPAILLHRNSGRGEIVDDERRDVVEPEILQQQAAAEMVEQAAQILFAEMRLDPQSAGVSDAAGQFGGGGAIDNVDDPVRVAWPVVPQTEAFQFVEEIVGVEDTLRHHGTVSPPGSTARSQNALCNEMLLCSGSYV